MFTQNPKARKIRKDAHYTHEEIQVINTHKEEYKQQITRELRGHIFKTKILVDLFNFWLEQGNAPEKRRVQIGLRLVYYYCDALI